MLECDRKQKTKKRFDTQEEGKTGPEKDKERTRTQNENGGSINGNMRKMENRKLEMVKKALENRPTICSTTKP